MICNNIYNKPLELTPNEELVLENLLRYCRDYYEYNLELRKTIKYKSTSYMLNSNWLFRSSKMNKYDYIKSFYHLLLSGIIEKNYRYDYEKFLYRVPVLV